MGLCFEDRLLESTSFSERQRLRLESGWLTLFRRVLKEPCTAAIHPAWRCVCVVRAMFFSLGELQSPLRLSLLPPGSDSEDGGAEAAARLALLAGPWGSASLLGVEGVASRGCFNSLVESLSERRLRASRASRGDDGGFFGGGS